MRIQRQADGDGTAADTSSEGSAGKRTLSQGLPGDLRAKAEASTGADLSTVRVHDDGDAHTSARHLDAMAFTLGHDIWFGAGQYNPGTPAGDRLIAHEVAHTVQQGQTPAAAPQTKLEVSEPGDALEVEADHAADAIVSGAPAAISRGATAGVARAPWNAAYGGQDPTTAVDDGSGKKTLTADAYKNKINTAGGPDLKAASDPANTGGKTVHKSKFRMTKGELLQVLEAAQGKAALNYMLSQGGKPSADENRKHAEEELAKYMTYCERAFDTMMIDTIEAQALFLAHGAGETVFAKMTEGQTNDTKFESDPANVKVSTSTASTTGQKYKDGVDIMDGPMRYAQQENGYRQGIDPTGAIDGKDENSFDKTFIGRGAIQATFRTSYVQAIEFMVKRAEDLRAQAATMPAGPEKVDVEKKATELETAADAIKTEPRNAADPKYAFLFSAAYMQMSPMVKGSAGGFTNAGMTGGYADAQGEKKKKAYNEAVKILTKHAADDAAAAAANPAAAAPAAPAASPGAPANAPGGGGPNPQPQPEPHSGLGPQGMDPSLGATDLPPVPAGLA